MDVPTLSLFGLVALALLFDYTNGFHDSANSIATVVATRVLRPRWAVTWAASFNFIAFLIVGTAVANTVGQTVKTEYFSMAVVFAALLGAIIWNHLSWHLGLPTSSSHALIGGLIGAGLAAGPHQQRRRDPPRPSTVDDRGNDRRSERAARMRPATRSAGTTDCTA